MEIKSLSLEIKNDSDVLELINRYASLQAIVKQMPSLKPATALKDYLRVTLPPIIQQLTKQSQEQNKKNLT